MEDNKMKSIVESREEKFVSVEDKGKGFFSVSLMYVLSACIASFVFGYQVSVLNTIKNYIVIEFGWCKDEVDKRVNGTPKNYLDCERNTLLSSFLLAAVFVGAVIGSAFSGYLVRYGRRFALLVIYYFFIVVSVLTSITHHFDTIFFARLLSGFGVGLITVSVPMYISEMSNKYKKGAYGVLHQLFITIGIFVAVLLGLPLGKGADGSTDTFTKFEKCWWRVMLLIPAFVSLIGICTLTFVFKEESPYFLYENGQIEEAKKTLKKINETDDVEDAFNAIKEAVEQNENAKRNSLSLFNALKVPSYRYVIVLGCVLSAFQQLTGINVLVANSNELYKNFLDNDLITMLSVIMTAVNCVMTIPAIYIVEKLGRKTLLLLGCFGIIIAYVPTAIANIINKEATAVKYISIVSTFVMIVSFAVSYGPVLWVYLHEMFPSEIKDGAASLASLINWVCAIIVIFPSDIIIKQSPSILFIIFAAMSVLSFLFVLFFVKETKGSEIGTSPYISLEERQKYMGKTESNDAPSSV